MTNVDHHHEDDGEEDEDGNDNDDLVDHKADGDGDYDDIEVKMKTTEILKYIGGVKKNWRRDLVIIGKSVYTTDDNEEDVRNEKSFNVLNFLKGWMEKMKLKTQI